MKQTLLILGGIYLALGLPVAVMAFIFAAIAFPWWLTILLTLFAWVAWPFIITGCFLP